MIKTKNRKLLLLPGDGVGPEVVAEVKKVNHPMYGKFVLKTKKYVAHDESNDCNIGDTVKIMETRPLSKSKRWRLVEILERAK